jgi:hypothetical protein
MTTQYRPSSHRAIVPISVEALVQMVLPPGTCIHDVRYEVFRNTVDFMVTNPELPEVCEGCEAPVVFPLYGVRTLESGQQEIIITFKKFVSGWEDEWHH